MPESIPSAHILIVDDQEINIIVLKRILQRAGYTQIHTTTDPRTVAGYIAEHHPDILLLDFMMPEMDGFEVMAQVQPLLAPDDFFPILILTADNTSETKRRALNQGAHDFITKPFDHVEVLLRIKNLLQMRWLYRKVQEQNQQLFRQNGVLEARVRERTAELEVAHREVVERLAQANEFRDDHTGAHIQRVGRLAALLSGRLGMSDSFVETIRQAATLHDVGKIAVADSILLKPSRLEAPERDLMRMHTILGAELLAKGNSEVIRMAERIAFSHHEHWDGSGYPNGLVGEEIPIEGRIVAVIDVFDALVHERPYKAAWPLSKALHEIESQSGSHFDPTVVDAFLHLPHDTF
jgi:putative two-component system response regulator